MSESDVQDEAPEEPQKKSSGTDEKKPGAFQELFSTVLWALGIALILRTFLFQPFHIPSGSMQPGLQKGDYLITSKYSLGYGKYAAAPLPFPAVSGRIFERKPERGDVIVFRPEGDTKNLIKRLIGLPGDQIQMIDGRLHINGQPSEIKSLGQEMRLDRFGKDDQVFAQSEILPIGGHSQKIYDDLQNSQLDNTGLFTVPAGHYFFMGDNRDHSADSRISVASNGAGYVPAENLMGRAEFVLLSVNDDFILVKPWTWLNLRGDRWFMGIK